MRGWQLLDAPVSRVCCRLILLLCLTSELKDVFDAKRLTGRKFADPILRLWPFKEIPVVVIQVQFAGEEKKFASREVDSVMLTKMKGPLGRLHGTPKTLPVGTKFDVLTDPHVEFEPAVEVRKFRCFARW